MIAYADMADFYNDNFGELTVDYTLEESTKGLVSRKALFVVKKNKQAIDKSLRGSSSVTDLQRVLFEIAQLSDLKEDWDSFGAPVPTGLALAAADSAARLAFFCKLPADSAVPSADGGVALCWDRSTNHAYIEFDNDGTVISARYRETGDPHVEEVGQDEVSLRSELESISRFFA
jgi:hypothetical protein